MEPAGDAVQRLIEEHRPLLVAAHSAGSDAHPGIDLGLERFARHILASTPDGAAAFRERLAELRAADFFLATACESGCPGAWERLSSIYTPRVRAMALRWGATEADADDVSRDLPGALLSRPDHGRAATQLGSYSGTGSLLAWLGTVADRELRRRANEQGEHFPLEFDAPSEEIEAQPSEHVVHSETGRRVELALENALLDLSAREFLLVAAKYRDGLSQREIARRLDISPPRVSYLLQRALERVRQAVRRDVPDETAAQWPDRQGLAGILRNVISHLLDRRPPA